MARESSLGASVTAWMTAGAIMLANAYPGVAFAHRTGGFSGSWSYAKRCDRGHYLSLDLQQNGDRVTGDWSEGTNIRGGAGQLQGEVRGDTLHVRYCSDDNEVGYSACPVFSEPEDRFRLEKGGLVRYQKYGAQYRRGVTLHRERAGHQVPLDHACQDPDSDAR